MPTPEPWQTLETLALEALRYEGRQILAPRTTEEAVAMLALGISGAAHMLDDTTVAQAARLVADLTDSVDLDDALLALASELEARYPHDGDDW